MFYKIVYFFFFFIFFNSSTIIYSYFFTFIFTLFLINKLNHCRVFIFVTKFQVSPLLSSSLNWILVLKHLLQLGRLVVLTMCHVSVCEFFILFLIFFN